MKFDKLYQLLSEHPDCLIVNGTEYFWNTKLGSPIVFIVINNSVFFSREIMMHANIIDAVRFACGQYQISKWSYDIAQEYLFHNSIETINFDPSMDMKFKKYDDVNVNISGRLWIKFNTISFWNYPANIFPRLNLVNRFLKHLNVEPQSLKWEAPDPHQSPLTDNPKMTYDEFLNKKNPATQRQVDDVERLKQLHTIAGMKNLQKPYI